MKNSLLKAALEYAELGFRVIPLKPYSKKPITEHGSKDGSTDPEIIKKWWQQNPNSNIGICTGSELYVLDIDVKDGIDGFRYYNVLQEVFGPFDTYTVSTPTDGLHVYFSGDGIKSLSNRTKLIPGLDFRGRGGLVVAPPSTTSAGSYEAQGNIRTLQAIPFNLANFLKVQKINPFTASNSINKGERNTQCASYSGKLRNLDVPQSIATLLIHDFAANTNPPMDIREAERCLESIYQNYEAGVSSHGTAKEYTSSELSELIDALNQKHATVMQGSKFVVLWEQGEELTLLRPEDFHAFYASRIPPIMRGTSKPTDATRFWIKHPESRKYEKIVFQPCKYGMENETRSDSNYNMWRGLATEPKKGDCSLILKHIELVLANGDPVLYQYIVKWVAQMFQDPTNRPGVALVFVGGQGAGKGILVQQVLRQIIGKRHSEVITGGNAINGRFNTHYAMSILLFADEVGWGKNRDSGILKGLITEPTILMEPKGIDASQVENNIHLIVASNYDHVAPVEKDDRRFFVSRVSDEFVGNRKYFNALMDEIKNGGREAFLYYLLYEVEVDSDELKNIPQSTALIEQKLQHLDSVEKFIYTTLNNGGFPIESDEILILEEVIASEAMYRIYTAYCKAISWTRPVDNTTFGIKIKKILPSIEKNQKQMGGERFNVYSLPNLIRAREEFEKYIRCSLKWSDVSHLEASDY